MEIGLDAFCSLRYVGIQTTHPPTNYKILQNVLNIEIENTTVRSPRSLEIVYKAIEVRSTNNPYEMKDIQFLNSFISGVKSKILGENHREIIQSISGTIFYLFCAMYVM